ncbi:hypothetical protein SBADM41S_10332 [Streptomyces badius]
MKAFAQAGMPVKSTRRWELAELDHPAVEPLIAYKAVPDLDRARLVLAPGLGARGPVPP